MRSGQYKLSSKGSGSEFGKGGGGDISSGQFKTSYKELPPLTPFPQDVQQPMQTDFINLDSLHLSVLKRVDERDEVKEGAKKKYKEHIYKGNRKRDSILRHKSCENVSVLTRGTVTRVEQKVRSLLRVDSKWNCESVSSTVEDISPTLGDMSDDPCKTDFWQAGKIVTMTKKPRLVSAHSHSALHTLSASSDNASCLSASSGYSSSSSSSSYGSFKSNESVCSSLTRHRNNSSGSQSSPFTDNSRMLFVDNPLYDVVPSNFLQVTEPLYSLDSSPYESFPLDDFSFKEENTLPTSRLINDPVAKECIEYFEKRISSSETLRKKWSLFICDPPERYNQINSDLISKGDAIIDSKFNAGFNSDMNLGVESNFILSEEFPETRDRSNQKKNQLDEKMELLRREIASLILQDNTLFKQLLTLHESISNLKVQTAMNSTQNNNATLSLGGSNTSALNASALGYTANLAGLHLGSTTPSDLESFTEEEEDEEEDEEEEEEDEEEEREEEYEEQIQSFSQIDYYDKDDSITQQNQTELFLNTGAEEEESFSFCEDKPSATSNMEDDEDDEGHCTDLSFGDTPSNSSSPASTLSSNSSEGISYSRNLYSEMTSDHSGSFTRCRKSYAPNARNRRRSSSVNRQSSSLECGTTTALVVIYADDEELLLNASRPRSHSFSPLTTFAFHDALSYSSSGPDEGHKANGNAGASPLSSFPFQDALGYTSLMSDEGPKANGNARAASDIHSLLQSHCQKNGKEVAEIQSKVTLASCSTLPENSSSAIYKSSNSNLSHPPYREALIM